MLATTSRLLPHAQLRRLRVAGHRLPVDVLLALPRDNVSTVLSRALGPVNVDKTRAASESLRLARAPQTPLAHRAAIRQGRKIEDGMVEIRNALAEKYPELKGQEMLGKLMEELRRVENEVALMRQGYNDSVELYKTTSQRIPEVFLAKSFGFKDSNFLRTELSVRKKPEISFD